MAAEQITSNVNGYNPKLVHFLASGVAAVSPAMAEGIARRAFLAMPLGNTLAACLIEEVGAGVVKLAPKTVDPPRTIASDCEHPTSTPGPGLGP